MGVRCSVFIATSLDGFISRLDGRIDWLDQANATVPAGEDCGFGAFFSSVDALVMGRNTFEQVLLFPSWPYGDKPLVVLSRTMKALPPGVPNSVTLSSEAPAVLVRRLEGEGVGHVYVDGGLTIQSFLAEGLVQELTLTVIPVLLGTGKPLFGALPGDVNLRLLDSRRWPFGFVQNRYGVEHGSGPAQS
jgi:dihydrofolate reductase